MAYYRFLGKHTKLTGLEQIIKAYRMYLEQVKPAIWKSCCR